MAGQGRPLPRACPRAGGLRLPAAAALALAVLLTAGAAAADVDVRIRLAWGGGEPRPWQGTIRISQGEISEVTPLGWEPDSPGSLQAIDTAAFRVVPRTPRSYDGCDLRVQATDNAKLLVQMWSATAPTGPPVEVPLAKVISGFSQFDLDDRQNRLFAQRSPGDMLRVSFARDALLFAPGERFEFEVQPSAPDLAPEIGRAHV